MKTSAATEELLAKFIEIYEGSQANDHEISLTQQRLNLHEKLDFSRNLTISLLVQDANTELVM